MSFTVCFDHLPSDIRKMRFQISLTPDLAIIRKSTPKIFGFDKRDVKCYPKIYSFIFHLNYFERYNHEFATVKRLSFFFLSQRICLRPLCLLFPSLLSRPPWLNLFGWICYAAAVGTLRLSKRFAIVLAMDTWLVPMKQSLSPRKQTQKEQA